MVQEDETFDGNLALGVLSIVIAGPLLVLGAALAILGVLSMWGVEVGPLQHGDVPEWLDVLYGGANGFKSFVAFMIGALAATGAATLIKWSFTGKWISDFL